jgi:hypothetical protein
MLSDTTTAFEFIQCYEILSGTVIKDVQRRNMDGYEIGI